MCAEFLGSKLAMINHSALQSSTLQPFHHSNWLIATPTAYLAIIGSNRYNFSIVFNCKERVNHVTFLLILQSLT